MSILKNYFTFTNSNSKFKIVKYILVFIQLFVGNVVLGQASTRAIIPGMKCSMELEEGFQLATRFSGFENSALNANILVSHLSSPLERNLLSVESDQMKVRGFHLVSKS